MQIISVKNLKVKYNRRIVLQDVNFEIERGDYVGLAGPNGAGKSTLVQAILGLVSTHEGNIELFGAPVSKFAHWESVGYLPQNIHSFNPIFPARVEEIVRLGLLASKTFPKRFSAEDKKKIDDTLSLFGIDHLKRRMISQLSGGQQQKVFLARALVAQPELLILDEPSSALDPQARDDFFSLIKNLNVQKKTTILLITHDTMNIGQYANKLLYIDKKMVFFGKFGDFCHSPEMQKHFGNQYQHTICHQHYHQ